MTTTASTKSLWDEAANLITATEKHPFLVSMVDGSLNLDSFRYYVIQDALFLTDFAQCLEILATKMEEEYINASSCSKKFGVPPYRVTENIKRIRELAVGIEEAEKELHRSFFTQWNINVTNNDIKSAPNTLLYTSYMLRVVSTRPYTEGLAVLLPCFWVYMHVGKCMLQLREEIDNDNNNDNAKQQKRPAQFDAWIDMYAGDEFEKEVTDYIAIVDTAIQHNVNNNANKDDGMDVLMKMKEHFVMCCKLEYMFWDQAQVLMDWPDFEGVSS